MTKANLKVYLDHHIERENLLYKRASDNPYPETTIENIKNLAIRDLYGDNSIEHLLRKPDFQRATWAWTPDDCVELLMSVLEEQVVPSVIMWMSPDGHWYVLDGGHRISVLLAWIKDDWGDRQPPETYKDPNLEQNSKDAGEKVRNLLEKKEIAPFSEYLKIDRLYKTLAKQKRTPDFELDSVSIKYATLVRRWSGKSMGFPILWVNGDYQKAEESFLKINRTGRRLSEWEAKLVENRTSSFARTVMSIAQISDAEHCWSIQDTEVQSNAELKPKVSQILQRVRELHDLLFLPPYKIPIDDPRQPLLATPHTRPETKPAYLAELLTIVEGKKGQKPETETLIKKDRVASASQIIHNGVKLVEDAMDVISNIYGRSPRSLGLMPLVYFYSNQGVHVRGLLYGMLYWLNHGKETSDVLQRKQIFTAHRAAFEDVLLRDKEKVLKRIGRRIGSGPEVTHQTASYFNGLLELLIRFDDEIQSQNFLSETKKLIETLNKSKNKAIQNDAQLLPEETGESEESSARLFTGGKKAEVNVRDFIQQFARCQICGGRYYPGLFTQIDHIQPRAQGGKTKLDNGRNTHPFCNNNREVIEELKAKTKLISLPAYMDATAVDKPEQMSFLAIFDDDNLDEQAESSEENADAGNTPVEA